MSEREIRSIGLGNYTELYYHFVWSTRERYPYIGDRVEERLFGFIRWKCGELDVMVHALNGMPDHIHLACTLPTKLSISEFVEKVKGTSSRFINSKAAEANELETCLFWQGGYGAITVSTSGLRRVVEYVDNQKIHHNTGTLQPRYETTFIDD